MTILINLFVYLDFHAHRRIKWKQFFWNPSLNFSGVEPQIRVIFWAVNEMEHRHLNLNRTEMAVLWPCDYFQFWKHTNLVHRKRTPHQRTHLNCWEESLLERLTVRVTEQTREYELPSSCFPDQCYLGSLNKFSKSNSSRLLRKLCLGWILS